MDASDEMENQPQEITYKELLQQLDSPFEDESFPPDHTSIITSEPVFELAEDETEVLKGLEYARLSDIYGSRRVTLFDKIAPDVIEQGCLCNAYFLSAVSALAEYPERIKSCFLTEGLNSLG